MPVQNLDFRIGKSRTGHEYTSTQLEIFTTTFQVRSKTTFARLWITCLPAWGPGNYVMLQMQMLHLLKFLNLVTKAAEDYVGNT